MFCLFPFRNEMLRLKIELETCHAEDRIEAVKRAQEEHIADVNQLKENFAFREQMLRDEIDAVKSKLADRNRRLDEANEKADKQIMQIRMILNKSEQDHQREINAQISQHEREMSMLISWTPISNRIFECFSIPHIFFFSLHRATSVRVRRKRESNEERIRK